MHWNWTVLDRGTVHTCSLRSLEDHQRGRRDGGARHVGSELRRGVPAYPAGRLVLFDIIADTGSVCATDTPASCMHLPCPLSPLSFQGCCIFPVERPYGWIHPPGLRSGLTEFFTVVGFAWKRSIRTFGLRWILLSCTVEGHPLHFDGVAL